VTGQYPAIAAAPVVEADVVPAVEPVAPAKPLARNLQQTQEAVAEQLGRYLQSSARNLEFQVDSDSGTAVIVVRDGQGNVIRRIPGEEALQLMRRLYAQSGTLVDSLA
jgi:uncharacterized FlaG/YvyC family protein